MSTFSEWSKKVDLFRLDTWSVTGMHYMFDQTYRDFESSALFGWGTSTWEPLHESHFNLRWPTTFELYCTCKTYLDCEFALWALQREGKTKLLVASVNICVFEPESNDSNGPDEFVECSFVRRLLVTTLGVGKSTELNLFVCCSSVRRALVTFTASADRSPESRACACNNLAAAVVDSFCRVVYIK